MIGVAAAGAVPLHPGLRPFHGRKGVFYDWGCSEDRRGKYGCPGSLALNDKPGIL